jgi:D-serine deaminase-like pyridoxal phosphate-dependent protein
MRLHDLPTPALWVDLAALDHNIDAMAAARPGRALRPHV